MVPSHRPSRRHTTSPGSWSWWTLAARLDGHLLIVEMVLPAGDTPHPGKILDMVMRVVPGGQERSEAEYAALLGKAGFRLSRVVATASAVAVVEAVPV